MTAQRGRPTRPGVSQAAPAEGRAGRGTATLTRGGSASSARKSASARPTVGRATAHPARQADRTSEDVRRAAASAAHDFPVDGSAALAVEADDLGPTRTRSVAEREAADARAAQRAADRVTDEKRKRLRVAPPLPVTVARAPFVAMLLFIVVAGVVGILVLTTMINANQFRLNHLQGNQAGLNQQEQQLQQNLAQQESPGSLVAAAHKLGLVPAGKLAYIRMPDGSTVGVPQPSAQTPSVTAQSAPASSTTGSNPSGGTAGNSGTTAGNSGTTAGNSGAGSGGALGSGGTSGTASSGH